MLFPGLLSGFNFRVDNLPATPVINTGTTLTANATPNTEGAYATLIADTAVTQDCYWMYVNINSGNAATSARNMLLDIAVDPAGGTSFTNILSNIVCGEAPGFSQAGRRSFAFPYFIKAGSEVGARIQSSVASATTICVIRLYGNPTNPLAVPVGAISQTFGTITNSNGNAFTPGNSADGTWVDLGTTSTPLWWWQVGWQIDNGTITAENTYIEVAFGDGTNKHQIIKTQHYGTTSETVGSSLDSHITFAECYMPVPAGVNIYIRGRCNGAPDTGYNATVIGIGG
jgi:hypothetical protein